MMASFSIASSPGSWPKPVIRREPVAAAQSCRICRRSSARSHSNAAASGRRAPAIPTVPIANSSSASATAAGSSPGNTRCGARWSPAWRMSTRSRAASLRHNPTKCRKSTCWPTRNDIADPSACGSGVYPTESRMQPKKDPENTLIMETSKGQVVIGLRPDLAPRHVERIKRLTREGFYDDVAFHRVIDGFMAQTGCPEGTGTGGSNYPDLVAEFNAEKHVRGTCSMARADRPDSANSQFFICFDDATFLDK